MEIKSFTREMTPAFNKRVEITTSGTFTAPVSGWYKFTIKGAGGGGGKGTAYNSTMAFSGGGGGEGGTTFAYEKMLVGETATITIGAGGVGATAANSAGGKGGDSSVTLNNNTYTAGGGFGGVNRCDGTSIAPNYACAGGSGTITGACGQWALWVSSTQTSGGIGGGNGGGIVYIRSTAGTVVDKIAEKGGGGGGAPENYYSAFNLPAGDGGDGYVVVEYFDPSLQ